jgi:hypothetical protein
MVSEERVNSSPRRESFQRRLSGMITLIASADTSTS